MQALRTRVSSDANLKELLQHSGILYAGGLIALVITFAQQILAANLLGSEGYGRFAIILSSSLVVMLFVDLRTWELATRLMAVELQERAHQEIVRITNRLLLVETVAGLIGYLLLLLAADFIAAELLQIPGFEQYIRIYALSVPLRLLAEGVLSALPRFFNRFDWVVYRSIATAVLRLTLIISPIVLGWGLTGAIIGALIAELINALLSLWIGLRVFKIYLPQVNLLDFVPPRQQPQMRAIGSNLWVMSTLSGLHQQAFIPILALLSTPAQVGLFRAGLDFVELIERITTPLTLVVSPKIMKLYEQKNYPAFMRYVKQNAMLFAAAALPLMLALALAGPFVFPLLLQGEGYENLPLVVAILAVGYGINMSITPWLRPIYLSTGYYPHMNAIMLVHTVVMFVLLIVLASPYGALGSALAKGSTLIFFTLIYLVLWQARIRRTVKTAFEQP